MRGGRNWLNGIIGEGKISALDEISGEGNGSILRSVRGLHALHENSEDQRENGLHEIRGEGKMEYVKTLSGISGE